MKTDEMYKTLLVAVSKLKEAMSFPIDDPHKESTIQRFEYTFELSWKLMSSILKDQGIEAYGIRNILREANNLGLISDTPSWFKYADARNQASHIYNESIAEEVYNIVRTDFIEKVEELITESEKYITN
ncbi:nucleotidyltransferase [candidate division WWE3 bacterium CG_4_9_14_0_2_um_filter_35_11]|uniref:Nucleotidyltransferase n=1 Tax=candidate division WWE3 bacterium CG_4_9_14_0_2_um_filter_35_11 TaxID=1975077 RepID=A0A2M8ELF0_UNCKA|nr:MAG: nucleotidyltransferase [candidate division WWE3 bacterium CG10_big_fil_rev_8_21_14_0_10_35_32]PJC23573.1 MAG: nucleotidyltransferase [candidate division WWE3 bacterium CG_4_9_14_0_2_um_filter_35_11]